MDGWTIDAADDITGCIEHEQKRSVLVAGRLEPNRAEDDPSDSTAGSSDSSSPGKRIGVEHDAATIIPAAAATNAVGRITLA